MNNLKPEENVNCGIITEIKKSSNESVWKDTGKISGIYKIVNKVNGKYYVGSSNNIKRRWINHRYQLNENHHNNLHLQNAWNKYSKVAFDFVILKETEKLEEIEQEYLDVAKTEKDKCYNVYFEADRLVMEESTKRKLSEAAKGRKHSQETRQKLRELQLGRIRSKETIEKFKKCKSGKNHPMWGKKHTKETINKMSASHKGINSGKYDFTITKWYNDTTRETFEGTQNEFYTKYRFLRSAVNVVVKGKRKSVHGWKIIP